MDIIIAGAQTMIGRYRERHTIEPMQVEDPLFGPIYICAHDGLRVLRRLRGYRHDPADVAAVARKAQAPLGGIEQYQDEDR